MSELPSLTSNRCSWGTRACAFFFPCASCTLRASAWNHLNTRSESAKRTLRLATPFSPKIVSKKSLPPCLRRKTQRITLLAWIDGWMDGTLSTLTPGLFSNLEIFLAAREDSDPTLIHIVMWWASFDLTTMTYKAVFCGFGGGLICCDVFMDFFRAALAVSHCFSFNSFI